MGHIALKPAPDGAVRQLFADSLVWDNHTCTTIHPGRPESLSYLRRHRQAGVDMVCLNVGFDPVAPENTVVLLADFRHWLRAHGDEFSLVSTADDIERVRRDDKLGVAFNIEGGRSLMGNVSMVSLYYELGV